MESKKQESVAKWMRIVLEVAIILFAAAVAWATLKTDVTRNKEDILRHENSIKMNTRGLNEVKADIREIKVEQRYISQGIDEIKKEIKNK